MPLDITTLKNNLASADKKMYELLGVEIDAEALARIETKADLYAAAIHAYILAGDVNVSGAGTGTGLGAGTGANGGGPIATVVNTSVNTNVTATGKIT